MYLIYGFDICDDWVRMIRYASSIGTLDLLFAWDSGDSPSLTLNAFRLFCLSHFQQQYQYIGRERLPATDRESPRDHRTTRPQSCIYIYRTGQIQRKKKKDDYVNVESKIGYPSSQLSYHLFCVDMMYDCHSCVWLYFKLLFIFKEYVMVPTIRPMQGV